MNACLGQAAMWVEAVVKWQSTSQSHSLYSENWEAKDRYLHRPAAARHRLLGRWAKARLHSASLKSSWRSMAFQHSHTVLQDQDTIYWESAVICWQKPGGLGSLSWERSRPPLTACLNVLKPFGHISSQRTFFEEAHVDAVNVKSQK